MPKQSRKTAPSARATETPSARNLGKITAPTLQRVFANERLFARLDAARHYPVVWLHGPPGAGKTTLAASYLAARGVKPLWCRLDEGDADPASVFLWLAEAAKLRAPNLHLPLLQPEFRTALPLFTRRFFRNLFATSDVSVVVLDDYHEVAAAAELHDCLPAGLEEVPNGCHAIVISRSAPPSQLARLRLNGRVDVIEPDALRLNTKEIRALADKRRDAAPEFTEERIASATQGWAAGVIVMLEAPMPCPAEMEARTAPLPEVLFDYFAGEVLQRMEPWAPSVLATLALMPTMTAITAERLTDRPEAGALLEDLYRRNYFTARDSAPEPRYRFHPLFRDFLRSATRKGGQDETLIKIRAATVLDEDDQADAAVQLLVETDQTEKLVGLVKRRAAALVEEGRNDTLFAWFSNFSFEQIANDAWLSYWRGTARVGVDPVDAYPHFMTALALFEAADDLTGQFAAWAGAAEAIRYHAYGDMGRFDPLIIQMQRLLARNPTFPSTRLELSISVSMATALSRRSADRAQLEVWRNRAHAAAALIGVPALSIRVAFGFAIIDLSDGNFAAASAAFEALPDPLTLDHLPLAQWAGVLAQAIGLAHRQPSKDIGAFAVEGLKKLEQSGFYLWMPMLTALAAAVAGGRGDVADCSYWLKRTEALAKGRGLEQGPFYYSALVNYKILSGDPDGAKAAADEGLAVAKRNGYFYQTMHMRLMRANAVLAANAWQELADELGGLDVDLCHGIANSLAFSAKLLRADLHFACGDAAGGRKSLSAALELGRQQGARQALVSAQSLRRLCKRAFELDIEPDFARTLIGAIGLKSQDPFDERWPWPIKIATLGGFSIEIDGEKLAFSGKTPKRLVSLVKAIAAFGGRAVPEAKIADALWPDEDADAAFNSLSIATHRLRKLLGDNDAIVVSNGTIGFNPARCWLDLWAFEQRLGRRGPDETREAFEKRVAEGLALYRGDFLPDEEAWWTAEKRDGLRKLRQRALAPA